MDHWTRYEIKSYNDYGLIKILCGVSLKLSKFNSYVKNSLICLLPYEFVRYPTIIDVKNFPCLTNDKSCNFLCALGPWRSWWSWQRWPWIEQNNWKCRSKTFLRCDWNHQVLRIKEVYEAIKVSSCHSEIVTALLWPHSLLRILLAWTDPILFSWDFCAQF